MGTNAPIRRVIEEPNRLPHEAPKVEPLKVPEPVVQPEKVPVPVA